MGRVTKDRPGHRTSLMKLLVAAMLGLAGAGQLHGTAIDINLGPPGVLTGINAQLGPISFSDLNGTPVNGSSLSLDFSFTNNEFVRLFSNTTPFFEVGLTLLTNAGTDPGVVVNGTAYLVDQNGNALPGFGIVGRSSSSNGSTGIGLFPLLADANGTPNSSLTFPLDFYGVHFDFTLPNDPLVNVTGGDLTFFGAGPNSQFAVGPHVPDTGSTWLLFLIGTSGLLAAARMRSQHRNRR